MRLSHLVIVAGALAATTGSAMEALRIQPACNRVTSLIRGCPLHVAHLPMFSATSRQQLPPAAT